MTKAVCLLFTSHAHASSFTLPPDSPLDTSENIGPVYVLVQRKQTDREKFLIACYTYTFLTLNFKGLENTSAHISTGRKDPENQLWVGILQMLKYKWIHFLMRWRPRNSQWWFSLKSILGTCYGKKLLALVFWQYSKPGNYIIPVHTPPMISNVILLSFFLETRWCYCEYLLQFQKPVSHGFSFLSFRAFRVLIN